MKPSWNYCIPNNSLVHAVAHEVWRRVAYMSGLDSRAQKFSAFNIMWHIPAGTCPILAGG